MRHKYPYLIIFIVLLASVYLVLFNTPKENNTITKISPTPTVTISDFTASFFINTNGLQRSFSSSMYHNLSPDVYITSETPSTIFIKKPSTKWKDFFSTLPMGISSTCLTTGTGQTFCDGDPVSSQSATFQTLQFILNGKKQPNVLEMNIKPNDILLISFGSFSDEEIQRQFKTIQATATSSGNSQVEL
jgi:hypothetical protein